MLCGVISGAPLIDIATTSLTGIRGAAFPQTIGGGVMGHPVYATLPLEPEDCLGLGSHFVRTGLLFSQPETTDAEWADVFGVQWQRHEGVISPLTHPLEGVDLQDSSRYPVPQWLQPVQCVDTAIADRSLIIADAPCPGLLDLCFVMRGTWQFMEDVTAGWHTVSALLDWSMVTIIQA